MANEITINAQLSASKSYLSVNRSQSIRVTMSGSRFSNSVQDVGTTHEQLAFPAEIATAGYCYFRNLDTTNYVEVGVVVAGTFYPVNKFKAGEVGVVRLATTTVYAKANTASVNLEYCLLAD